jgi:hypothetical protein
MKVLVIGVSALASSLKCAVSTSRILLKIVTLIQYWLCLLTNSCSHWRRHQWSRRHAGRVGQRLFTRSVCLPRTSASCPRPLVVHSHVQVPQVFLLQELRLHAVPLLVRVLLRLFRPGKDALSCRAVVGRGFSHPIDVHFIRPQKIHHRHHYRHYHHHHHQQQQQQQQQQKQLMN